jgi:hypothetical protein
VDDTTQYLTTTDWPIAPDDGHGDRRLLSYPLVGPRCIEVCHVLAQDTAQMGLVDDQQLPQAFFAHRPDPALREGVSIRRSKRRVEDGDAFGLEDSIERFG